MRSSSPLYCSSFLHKVHAALFPVASVHKVLVRREIELVHSEDDREVLGLPELFVGVLIAHAKLLHDASAARIVGVVGCRHVGYAIFFEAREKYPLRG